MIGVDTNVLLRLLIVDDPAQNAAAKAFFGQRSADDPAFISGIVLAETVWVLRRRLSYSRRDVEDVVRRLLSSAELVIEDGARLSSLFSTSTGPGTDIADFLVAWASERMGCGRVVTFDVRAARAIPSMELLV
ncbi:PIN domain-containing protein [Mesorhizobium sp. LHD-90]|uniref:PIN domain-containing protein n=1 Tax=Mesorhizobium sp. LHD-90 TaxID=3071414 RepID=UPI0027DEB68D|nr:PIN domain-containing protein [Mesorhizobium sp. LHD-90]MDQ6437005.1 PIN domain-containing protein [Mesorhizobium sp. LHD-90]